MRHRFSNALIHETSPYLLQHAHNPVQWYPWGEEALGLAKERQCPILVSIGYSACHWCHVMERESFENEEVASIMNEHFINVKIDREELTDLDNIYMDAVQAISGSGGWPLNVFLTPEGKPFYGGTYYPPGRAFSRSSWTEVLEAMHTLWRDKRPEAEAQAEQLTNHMEKAQQFIKPLPDQETTSPFTSGKCTHIKTTLLLNADRINGGFGQPPKFLQTFALNYLLAYSRLYNDVESSRHALFSLTKMLQGGIYDQLGGGISRYSTDEKWLAPHFEKMLYDNALLVSTLSDAYRLSPNETLKQGIIATLAFVVREMKNPKGGFYTALDADSEAVEGKFYTWTAEELAALLGEDASLFSTAYGVEPGGNWEHTNILHVSVAVPQLARQFDLAPHTVQDKLDQSINILLRNRNQRVRPSTDDKILLSTNGLLLSAFCKAYIALGDSFYRDEAVELARYIFSRFAGNEQTVALKHTYKDGKAKFPAFLDDYAYLIQACLALQEVTGNQEYLEKAAELTHYVIDEFSDEQALFFKYTHAGQEDIVVRKTELYDGATPSANAVMCSNLMTLATLCAEGGWKKRALGMLNQLEPAITKYPGSFGVWAFNYLLQTVGQAEVVLTGKSLERERLTLLEAYLPNVVFQTSEKFVPYPLLEGKNFDAAFTGYLCYNYACDQPVKKIDDIIDTIKKTYTKNADHNNS